MVNTLKRIYNKTPWQQRRLSQPLQDPNYVANIPQQSTIGEEDEHSQDLQAQEPHQLQRQISIASPSSHGAPNSLANATTADGQPLRRGMTRADTKISHRKTKKDSRRVFVNIPPPAAYLDSNGMPKTTFGSNRINTAKYTTLSFLPKNLFEQFRRVANMFFLFMAIIQLTPIFTVGSPFLTVFPLCFVVGVTAIKDGFEDYKRHIEDRNFNQRLCPQLKNVVNYNYPTESHLAAQRQKSIFSRVWRSIAHGLGTGREKSMRALKLSKEQSRELPTLDLADLPMEEDTSADAGAQQQQDPAKQPEFIKEQWHNLRVGDVIMLKNNQAVPADAIILSTSEAEGSCYIETKDLDGETNLKTRSSLHETSKYNTARRMSRLKCYIDVEPINANLFSFNGSLTMLARKRQAGAFGNPSGGYAAGHRNSQYAASITSSMVSSVRGSMEDNEETYVEPLQGGEGVGLSVEGQHPTQAASGGTAASDYARLHKSPSHRRRSRLSGAMDMSTGSPSNYGGDKQELSPEPEEQMDQDDQHPSSRPAIAKRSSLYRTATSASMAGASEMAKSVLKANYEQQMQGQQPQPLGVLREQLSGPGAINGAQSSGPINSGAVRTKSGKAIYKETTVPVDINNTLLRGHVVRNTHWVIAVIVATGTETKIMLNSGETPSKRSRIEKTMNIQVAINFLILLLLCIVCAVGSSIYDRRWRDTSAEQLWDMSTYGVVVEGVITFFTSLIIFQNIIPISLYISIEFVKTFQAYFIWQDSDMYDVDLDEFCTPKTWNLTDDLGQIEYVFSDKTGTLTRNIMEFKKCSINGKIYGNNAVAGQTDAEKGLELMAQEGPEGQGQGQGQQQQDPSSSHQNNKDAVLKEYEQEIRKTFEPTYMDALEDLTFADPELLRDMNAGGAGVSTSSESRSTTTAMTSDSGNDEGSTSNRPPATSTPAGGAHDGSPASNIRDFFTILALCHTVVVEQPEEEINDDDDDDFGMDDENGSPKDKDSGDNEDEGRHHHLGLREKLKKKAEAAGLSVPGSNTNGHNSPSGPGTRSRKNSNNGSIPPPGLRQLGSGNGSDTTPAKPTLNYRAESPDEAALVSAAKNVGFVFVSRGAVANTNGEKEGAKGGTKSRQNVNLNILGQDYTYEQLDLIKFNSTRKRMTVIVREPQELGGRILLLTKGADNVIFERLSHSDEDQQFRDQTEADIETFSNMGLRTLTLAQRVLDQETYDAWAAKYADAGKALDDRAQKLDKVAEEIETDLTLVGASAIEDKLQEGVPESIAALREAGIKVWVLTGDKLETAINIGFASRLLEKNMKLHIMKMSRNEEPTKVLLRFKGLVQGVLSGKGGVEEEEEVPRVQSENQLPFSEKAEVHEEQEQVPQQTHENTWDNEKHLPPTPSGTVHEDPLQQEQGSLQHALIVDGSALKILLDDPESRQDLIKLSDVCFSVICCRASPLQKALVVELIRRGKKTVCLAIGDGANDVSMIQAANIGVGIAGQEGMQAAMASDYSITQFRFIRKLVLVHGHWGYMRIAEMILNFFFKNVLWVAAVLWFQIYCGFSANLFYDYTFVSLYNLMLTAVPVLVLGATDQDLIAPYVLRYPGVYRLGIHQKRYNQYRFVAYMLDGVWQSLIVFWFWRGVFGINVLGRNGIDSSLLEFSTAVAITNVVIASLYVGLHTYHWTWLMHFAVWGSITFLVLLVLIYGEFTASPIYHVGLHLFSQGPFWFLLLLAVTTAFLVRYTVLFVSAWWFPDDVHVVRGIMISEKWNAIANKVKWTGLAPDGMTPQGQSEQEKAILKKEDEKNAEKAAEKAAKKAAKQAAKAHGRGGKNYTKGPSNPDDQPYDLTMIQINVNDTGAESGAAGTAVRGASTTSGMYLPTPLEIQQQLLAVQQQQQAKLAAEAGSPDQILKPNDPSFQHSRRTSSYNYVQSLQDKETALPPVPSPSLPSLPSRSAGSSNVSLQQAYREPIAPSSSLAPPPEPHEQQRQLPSRIVTTPSIHKSGSSTSLSYQPPSPSPLSAQVHSDVTTSP
ncbi:phospholipid-translocating ATPase [Entomortierella parvispora]|uniref:P-type phospholipid transporter n=1 Tax=Entomortierella parvispora TaxID=205924 RepID=A0A9P3H648_9FUNG|nr:phospholipid-translocating ATPase [Entomortierella parvispora]